MARQVTDEMLRALVREWVMTLPAQYPEEGRPRRFSLRFRRKMWPILRAARREEGKEALSPLFRPGRFGLALVAAALLTATVAMAFPAVRERVFRMVWEYQGDHTRIYYEEVAEDGAPPSEGPEGAEGAEEQAFTLYRFSYIPEGFALEEYTVIGASSHHETFFNEEGLGIALDQERLGGTGVTGMTGHREPEEIFLNGVQRAWYVEQTAFRSIHWDDGEYSFGVLTYLSREETIKIAESLVPVEEPFADVTFRPYHAAYLPEGFAMTGARKAKDAYQLRCENAQGGWLTLDQVWAGWEAFSEDYGEEAWPTGLCVVGSRQVDILEKTESRSLYWNRGEYDFRLTSDVLSAEELLDVVINLHPAGETAEVFLPYRMGDLPEGFERSGYGYSGKVYYEDYYGYDPEAEYGGVYGDETREINFYQERPGGSRYALDPGEAGVTAVTLEGGRTVLVLPDPPEGHPYWHRYAFAVSWEEEGYLLTLWSDLPWEETVKIIEGILKM